MPLPEESLLELAALDAALAGDPVDPQYADLAELALLLADTRPELAPAGAAELDRRFAAVSVPRVRRIRRPSPPAGRRWFLRPSFGAVLAVPLILAVLVIVLPHGGGGSSSGALHSFSSNASGSAASSSAQPTVAASAPKSSAGSSSSSAAGATDSASGASASPAGQIPTPQSNGRRVVQTSQLSLTAADARIATVAQELFNVVGSERGIVKHSQVSTGSAAYASFTLSIPTANLSATLARLAQLRYARVASSSASTSDVNSQYLDDQRRLADARALRSSLLRQLQAATTTPAVDSLKAQISDAESTIASDESSVNALQSRISFSAVSVTISTAAGTPAPSSGGGGFTIGRAAHDALDVLKVAACVALIVLAAVIPLSLLGVLAAWFNLARRRRRREQALDAD